MEFILKFILFLHVAAGITTLLSGPVAIFYNFKNQRNHRIAGKVFLYAMIIVCVSSILGYIKRPDSIFYQFLLCIALIVGAGIIRGVRSILMMKGARITKFDLAYSIALGILGLVMVGRSVWLLRTDIMIAFPILFGVFGAGAINDAIKNIRIFSKSVQFKPNDWLKLHLNSMLGAFIASTTAFTVNVAHGIPWYLQWFGPTLLLVPVIVYFSRKVSKPRIKYEV